MPGEVNALAFADEGKLLAAAGLNEKIHLWDLSAAPIAETRSLVNQSNPFRIVWGLAATPDGKRLAAATDRQVQVWDPTASAAGTPSVDFANSAARAVAFSPDGKWLVAADRDVVTLYDAATRQPRGSYSLKEPPESVCFAPDSRHIAVGIKNGAVFIFRPKGL
jgi:WD40 repeat protein